MEEGKDGELILVFARRATFQDYYSWRPIAFDVEGKRHLLRPRVAAGNFGVMLERWSSNPETLPASKVAYVGLEGLTLEGFRRAADVAAKQAEAQGLKVLPFPIVGKPYPFKLTDLRGNIIDSDDLRGKIVLLDLWATWCFPCMKKMPVLKELYTKHHASGFEIVGINFDQDQQTCISASKELDIPWQQVMAPTEEMRRDIWMRAMGIQSLPRLLLIDREGILRIDCKPDELDSRVTELMSLEHEGNKP
jgi:thiol-disulfide isomerase/thioredoxin